MQSVSSRIWTRVTEYISYDDNHGHLVSLLGFPQLNHVQITLGTIFFADLSIL